MAFPTVSGRATTSVTTDTTTPSITLPTFGAGDLLVVVTQIDNNPTVTAPSGWTNIVSRDITSGTLTRMRAWYRVAVGGDPTSFDMTLGTAECVLGRAWAITSYTGVPEAASQTTTTTQSTITVPALNPSGWATADTLWIAVGGWGGGTPQVSTYPTGFTQTGNVRNTTTGDNGTLLWAEKEEAIDNQPSTSFTLGSTITASTSAMIAVQGTSVSGNGVFQRIKRSQWQRTYF